MAIATNALRSRLVVVFAFAIAGVAFAGCGDDGGAKVDVTLGEFIVEPDPTSEDAGEIEFVGDNGGGETHELVVVRAANAEELPTDADGAVDEAQLPEGALIGEIEDIEAGTSKSVTLDLEAGDYVLFCNVTEEADGEVESHFAEGMHADFEAE
ncbi:MAG: hypothetical protein ABWZ15_11410 [Acidimicrobiia bacterium]